MTLTTAPPAPMPAYVWQPTAHGDTPSHNAMFTVWTYRPAAILCGLHLYARQTIRDIHDAR
jgi:hypothetical protein